MIIQFYQFVLVSNETNVMKVLHKRVWMSDHWIVRVVDLISVFVEMVTIGRECRCDDGYRLKMINEQTTAYKMITLIGSLSL